MRVRWTPLAKADLQSIIQYIAEDNVTAALSTADRIVSAVDALSDFPKRGRRGEEPGTLELVITRTPYLAVYRLRDELEVLRVLHGAQQWPPEQ